MWTSVDGFTWSRVSHDPSVFAVTGDGTSLGRERTQSVTAGGPGLVAVGTTGFAEAVFEEAVWTSPDGITWILLPQSSDTFDDGRRSSGGRYLEMSSVTDAGSSLVEVGAVWCGESESAAVWHD